MNLDILRNKIVFFIIPEHKCFFVLCWQNCIFRELQGVVEAMAETSHYYYRISVSRDNALSTFQYYESYASLSTFATDERRKTCEK